MIVGRKSKETLITKLLDWFFGFRSIQVRVTKPVYIYALRLNNSRHFVYIGKTNCPQTRLNQHKSSARKGQHKNQKLQSWINKNRTNIVMEVIDKTSESNSATLEMYYITRYNNLHPRRKLLNIRVS